MKEIERKFLVSSIPENFTRKQNVEQIYIADEEDSETRVRCTEQNGKKKYEMTTKSGIGKIRGEINSEIFEVVYDNIKSDDKYKSRISKIRYIYDQYKPLKISIDKFARFNMMEIEYQTEDVDYIPPDLLPIIINEVTGNSMYYNKNLAKCEGWKSHYEKEND